MILDTDRMIGILLRSNGGQHRLGNSDAHTIDHCSYPAQVKYMQLLENSILVCWSGMHPGGMDNRNKYPAWTWLIPTEEQSAVGNHQRVGSGKIARCCK